MLTPDITVDVKFYKTEDKGRKIPTPANFFACISVIDNQNHDCRLLLEKIGSISPGDFKTNVPIKFLCSELVLPKLQKGKKFYLKEFGIIAECKVIEIINTEYMQ